MGFKLWTVDRGLLTKSGFTLLEVLVVLALGVLFASMMAGFSTDFDEQNRFDETRKRMLEIKKALLGGPNTYTNGRRQFTGYIADMGVLPELVDVRGTREDNTDDQPLALWRKGRQPEGRYHREYRIWAGWRGPYIEPPVDDVLRDGWGNPFVFSPPDPVNYGGKTYQCRVGHKAYPYNMPDPASLTGWCLYWEEVSARGGEAWIEGKEYFHFRITSYGADGKLDNEEEVSGYEEDITLAIDKTEYTGEVAGHVATDIKRIAIYYPGYRRGRILKHREINNLISGDTFRFGSAPVGVCVYWRDIKEDPRPCIDMEYYYNPEDDPLWEPIDIPMGVRSIKVINEMSERFYVFTVEPTGNWVGTVH